MPYLVSRPGLTGRVAILKNDFGEELQIPEESLSVLRGFLPYEDDSTPDPLMPLYVETFKDVYGQPSTRPGPRHRVWELADPDPEKW